jgi:hypothetical protein
LDIHGTIDLNLPQPVPDLTLYGELQNSRFGAQIQAGDFDGDGLLDLAVAAPLMNLPAGDYGGRVYIFFHQTLQLPFGVLNALAADVKIDGGTKYENAGSSLAAIDINGDNRQELVIGSPGAGGPNGQSSGRVYVLEGRSKTEWEAIPSKTINLADATISGASAALIKARAFLGVREDDRLGESLAVGDFNGDGVPDLFLGADHQDEVIGTGGGTSTFLDVGYVHMILGDQILAAFSTWDLAKMPASRTFMGRSEFDLFGDTIRLFNWDHDTQGTSGNGTDDLWIAAPYAEPTPPVDHNDDRGTLSMIPGSATAFIGIVTQPIRFPALATRMIVGPTDTAANETLFGGHLEFGDVIDDPVEEMVVSASLFDRQNGASAGAVFVLARQEVEASSPQAPLDASKIVTSVRIVGETQNDRFGFRTKILQLASGPKLVAGAPGKDSSNRQQAGAVYILDLPSMVFTANLFPTPTYQPTVTPTLVPTVTPIPTITDTPTPTLTPLPANALDLNGDSVFDFQDLLLFSGGWMENGKSDYPYNPATLLQMIEALETP